MFACDQNDLLIEYHSFIMRITSDYKPTVLPDSRYNIPMNISNLHPDLERKPGTALLIANRNMTKNEFELWQSLFYAAGLHNFDVWDIEDKNSEWRSIVHDERTTEQVNIRNLWFYIELSLTEVIPALM